MKLKRLTIIVLSFVSLLAFSGAWLGSTAYASTPKDEVCQGLGGATGGAGDCTTTGPTLTNVVRNIVNVFSVIVGILAVIMLIFGGFRYVTAGGDSNNLTAARQTIIYALVGLAIVVLSQFLVWFVLQNLLKKP